MMKRRVLTFVAVMAACAAFAWIGGYDFDVRSPDVAMWTFMAAVIAGTFAAGPWLDD